MSTETAPLAARLPRPDDATADEIFSRFVDYVTELGLELYPAQEEALIELLSGKNVILNTPTGSGKSLVASALHFKAMAEGKRSYYTSPIKALASEKFFALCAQFGADNVGMLTGDAAINRDAPIVCCTAEILANVALREGEDAPVDCVVIDEFHYYADRDRGVAWEVPLLVLRRATFLLMSATIGNAEFFQERLTKLTGRETALVRSEQRPVPLDYEYREVPLHETIAELIEQGRYPVYVVNFTQRACAEEAQNLMSTNFSSKEDKAAIAEALREVKFDTPYGKEIQRFVRHGIGLHHAGLLPKYRLLVEKLSQRGLLKIICGTDTLGVGVNIPIRTVLFTKLCKYDGEKTAILSVRDFKQIAGRAGRKGFDDQGTVVAQAPEHVIENLRLEAKAASDPSKRKFVRKKPPEKGYVHWDRETFQRLVGRAPEPLVSRFQVTHAMLLNLLQRKENYPGGAFARAFELIDASHLDERAKAEQKEKARLLFRSLRDAGVVRMVGGDDLAPEYELEEGIDEDFSLNHALSLYLLETLGKLEPEAPEYELDVLTLVESVLENPDVVLQRQLDKLKTEKLMQLKAEGVEYDERMAELEKLDYPKPHKDFVYATFNDFAARHPWVGHENIRPKSVAREIYERGFAFNDYVIEYGLQRSEGLLLRYLSDVYKALVQNVPDASKTEPVWDAIAFFRTMVRGVDSSLVDEWEGIKQGGPAEGDASAALQALLPQPARRAPDFLADPKAFAARVRSELHRLLQALAAKDYEEAARCVARDEDDPWTPARIEEAMAGYWAEHAAIRVDRAARAPAHTFMKQRDERRWDVSHAVVDPAGGEAGWSIDGEVDLDRWSDPAAPFVALRRIGG